MKNGRIASGFVMGCYGSRHKKPRYTATLRCRSRPIGKKGNKDIVKAYGPGAFEFSDSFLAVRVPYNPLALDSPLSDGDGVSGGEVESDDFAAILSLVSESGGATTADIVSGTGIPKSHRKL